MKRKVLLLSLCAGISALVLSSYQNGPAQGGAGNHTGSGSSQASCSGSGCHAANNTNTSFYLSVLSLSGNTVTNYVPGTTYRVELTGANTGGFFPKFGFQASSVKT